MPDRADKPQCVGDSKPDRLEELPKGGKRVARAHVASPFLKIERERLVVGMLRVRCGDVKGAAGLEDAPEHLAHGAIIAQMFEYVSAYDFVKRTVWKVESIQASVLEPQAIAGNCEQAVEELAAFVHLCFLDADADDIISFEITLIAQHAVAAASIEDLPPFSTIS